LFLTVTAHCFKNLSHRIRAVGQEDRGPGCASTVSGECASDSGNIIAKPPGWLFPEIFMFLKENHRYDEEP
jgi:hypothetical protein